MFNREAGCLRPVMWVHITGFFMPRNGYRHIIILYVRRIISWRQPALYYASHKVVLWCQPIYIRKILRLTREFKLLGSAMG